MDEVDGVDAVDREQAPDGARVDGFSVRERVLIAGVLPGRGSAQTLRTALGLARKLEFTVEEAERIGLRTERDAAGREVMRWNAEPVACRVELMPAERALLRERLAALDAAGELKPDLLGLFERFVENEER